MEGQNTKKKDYKGQILLIGLDVHKKTWKVTVSSNHLILKTFTYPPNPKDLVAYLQKHYPGATYISCYEAGYFGYWIHRELEELGIKNLVVNPSDVPTSDKEKNQKRDKLDSRKLAKCLRGGLLEGIYVPSIEQEQDRALLRGRKRIVRDMTRWKNRIKSYLSFTGIKTPEEFENSTWSKQYIKWLKEIKWVHISGAQTLIMYLNQLASLREQLKEVNKLIVQLGQSERYKSKVNIIRSIKGFGLLSSMIILTELGPIERFKNESQLKSYVGLIPTSKSSGEKEILGSISKRGNKYVKETLIECAWRAVGSDPSLSVYYEQLCKRMNGNQAIIRIASKLLKRIRAMQLKGQEYEIGMP